MQISNVLTGSLLLFHASVDQRVTGTKTGLNKKKAAIKATRTLSAGADGRDEN